MSDLTPQQRITAAILTLRSEYISEAKTPSYYEINNGDCEDFGEEIVSRLGDDSPTYTVCGENFYIDASGGDDRWDKKLLMNSWGMTPPRPFNVGCVEQNFIFWSRLGNRWRAAL